ncbi:MAG: hypothetical protein GY898_23255 [Proteobacteria bacterium]|nr:hypothetical protein [Pseudomonadota bacterium]
MTLQLRCREPESSSLPADIAAFASGARTVDAESGDPIAWLLSSAPSPEAVGGLAAREVRAGIPTPEEYIAKIILNDPDTRSWNFTFKGRTARTLTALALAAGLAIAPAAAQAEHHEEAETSETSSDGEAEEAPAEEAPAPVEEAPAEPAAEPLSYEGDALWAAVRGAQVEITLRGGTRITGIVLTQAGEELAIARDPDGTVARVPKHMVSRLRVLNMGTSAGTVSEAEQKRRDKANTPPPDGKGLTIAGTVLTVSGGSMMLAFGLAHLANSSFFYYGAPLMIIGANLIGPGIPMLAHGVAQQEARREWDMKHDVQIGFAPTKGGFAGSLQFQF